MRMLERIRVRQEVRQETLILRRTSINFLDLFHLPQRILVFSIYLMFIIIVVCHYILKVFHEQSVNDYLLSINFIGDIRVIGDNVSPSFGLLIES